MLTEVWCGIHHGLEKKLIFDRFGAIALARGVTKIPPKNGVIFTTFWWFSAD